MGEIGRWSYIYVDGNAIERNLIGDSDWPIAIRASLTQQENRQHRVTVRYFYLSLVHILGMCTSIANWCATLFY
jgi:hypothetical protein